MNVFCKIRNTYDLFIRVKCIDKVLREKFGTPYIRAFILYKFNPFGAKQF